MLVRCHGWPAAVTVEVSNDGRGRGGGHSPDGGYGLKGLRERTVALGGTFTAGPKRSSQLA